VDSCDAYRHFAAKCVELARRMESGEGKHSRTKSSNTKNHASDDDCADEPPDKYVEPAVSEQITGNDAKRSTDYSRDL
jgi:hypothetical protein